MVSAVLVSAGLDSAVLAADEARTSRVYPVYVSAGLAWEPWEMATLERLLTSAPYSTLAPLTVLTFTVRDLYPPTHWAIVGEPPAFDTPDEDVYLLGRNVVLLSKAAIYCARQRIGRLVLGPLAGNPFPDATPEFFDAMGRALSLGLAHPIEIAAPFARLDKSAVIRRGMELGVPLAQTLSCMNPQAELHCGRCSKCRERRDAFAESGVADPTTYAKAPAR